MPYSLFKSGGARLFGDTSWVEGTLVRLYDAGVSGLHVATLVPLPSRTQSQVRPWTDTGVAQGRVLSPFLFNLLVNGL